MEAERNTKIQMEASERLTEDIGVHHVLSRVEKCSMLTITRINYKL